MICRLRIWKMRENLNMVRNLEKDVADGLKVLKNIRDPRLRGIALSIFAPRGVKVPAPPDHASALVSYSGQSDFSLFDTDVAEAFAADSQAMSVLVDAVNKIHGVYGAASVAPDRMSRALRQIQNVAKAKVTTGENSYGEDD